ncbi:MAG: hypothetical protein P9L97_00825 [Candidatus Tenebribacter davisii]|nr:hypothetical protein [Candidatus Tenebribacter davisii]
MKDILKSEDILKIEDIFKINNNNKVDNEIEKEEETSTLEEVINYINAGNIGKAGDYLEDGFREGFEDGFINEDDINFDDVVEATKALFLYYEEHEEQFDEEDKAELLKGFIGPLIDEFVLEDYFGGEYIQKFIDYVERVIRAESIAQARLEEQKRIMSNLSHTVKNIISSIIDPLENMRIDGNFKISTVDNAIRGANLVRGLVNAMNLSFSGSIEDFIYDIDNAGYNDSSSIKQLFIESLKYSIGAMFDGKYFNKFMRNYFPNKSIFLDAKNKWNDISQTSDSETITSFLDIFMLQTEFNFAPAKDFVIGNDKGSSLKLLILIQEMIFNAVKYSSFVSKQERFLKIIFNSDADHVSIKVSNKFQPKTKVKSSGLGHVIIDNFSKLLETKPVTNTDGEIYSVEVKFKNMWEV